MNNSSTVLKEIQSLKQIWRTQNFSLTKEQQSRYDELMELRKAFIAFWKEEGRILHVVVIGEIHVADVMTLRLNLTGQSVVLSRNL